MKTLTVAIAILTGLAFQGCRTAHRAEAEAKYVGKKTGHAIGHATEKTGEGVAHAGEKLERKTEQ
jgi:hypothetical protein